MVHYTLIARINAGGGKFPFINVQFSKNHRPVPIEGLLLPMSNERRQTHPHQNRQRYFVGLHSVDSKGRRQVAFLYELRSRPSRETGRPIGESTVFNYFLKVMVFLNDRGIGKHVGKDDWVQK